MRDCESDEALKIDLDDGHQESYAYFKSVRLIEENLGVKVNIQTRGPLREFFGDFDLEKIPFLIEYKPGIGTNIQSGSHLSPDLQGKVAACVDTVRKALQN